MANGERIVSQANSRAFDEGYDRNFGTGRRVERGRWVYDPEAKALVSADEYRAPVRALDAPIIADRIHEGTHYDDGDLVRDIGSRRKRREFLREKGWEDAADASPQWREQQVKDRERLDDRKRRQAMEQAKRVLYARGQWR
jgi:hypothetical protein